MKTLTIAPRHTPQFKEAIKRGDDTFPYVVDSWPDKLSISVKDPSTEELRWIALTDYTHVLVDLGDMDRFVVPPREGPQFVSLAKRAGLTVTSFYSPLPRVPLLAPFSRIDRYDVLWTVITLSGCGLLMHILSR